MKTGTVKLIYLDEVIKQLDYDSVKHRKQIMETWIKGTGIKFEKCVIQVRPDIKKTLV